MKNRYIPLFFVLLISVLLVLSLAGCSSEVKTTTPAASATTPAQTPAPSTTQAPAAPKTTTPAPSVVQTTASPTQAPAITLSISAAASLTDALKEINALYIKNHSNVTITPNFAGSGTLQKQIEQGAPADLFISAAAAQMDALAKGNLIIAATRKNLLINSLVLVVPNDSTLGLTDFKDLASDKVTKIAVGDPKSVPAGTYAQQAFDQLGITAQVTSKYVMGADVKAVLSYVESGNVEAGLVYLTDAKISTKVKIVANAPAEINAKIVYPIAVVAASKVQEAAAAYENYLFSAEAKTVFEKYGFTLVSQ
jgi:molybdate transport system substrate-binding protein